MSAAFCDFVNQWEEVLGYTIRSIVCEASCHPVTQSFGHLIIQSFGHLVIQSLGHLVTWSLGHLVTSSVTLSLATYFQQNIAYGQLSAKLPGIQSFGHLIIQSFGHIFTQSLGHLVTRSLGHLVTWSLDHWVTWSLGHLVPSHYSSYLQRCD